MLKHFYNISTRPATAFKNAPIRIKLAISFSLALAIVLIVSAVPLYLLAKSTIESDIESELQNTTAAIKNMVQTAADLAIRNHLKVIAEKNREIVNSLYQKSLSGSISEAEAKKRAGDILLSQHIGNTGYIYCLGSNGVLQVHPEPSLVGIDISNYSFARRQMTFENNYIEYEWKNPGDREKQEKALYMTYFQPWDWIISASSYRKEFKDLVLAKDFAESIMALQFGETGYSYIIDMEGNLIVHPAQPNTNIYDSRDSNGRYFIRHLIEQKNGRILYPWKNPGEEVAREKLVIFNYLPDYDMIVASSSYLEEFYRPLTRFKFIILFSLLFALLLTIPFVIWLGEQIAKPLEQTARRFHSAGKGDVSIRMETETTDEIGKMASGFNDFMEQLTNYRNELEDLNKNLEKRVEERTAELQKALNEVKTLSGLLPICSGCKKIRDDTGYWQQIESYISKRSYADFSHSICPDCMAILYPECLDDDD